MCRFEGYVQKEGNATRLAPPDEAVEGRIEIVSEVGGILGEPLSKIGDFCWTRTEVRCSGGKVFHR